MWGITVFLCFLWAITLLYGEMLAFWLPLSGCSWPPLPTSSSLQGMRDAVKPAKVAVLADPQLMDRTSIKLSPGSLALEVAQFYTDVYMRRCFRSAVMPFEPDLVVFLGDMFDGGPYLSDQEWEESLNRFNHIFMLNDRRGKSHIPTYYLPGNHDIGYSSVHSLFPKVISRYENEFGARNYRFVVGNVEFVVVDAQTLDGSKHGSQTSLSWSFMRNISKDAPLYPRVLLTHIPLYRPDKTPCGPYRSSSIINQRLSRAGPGQEVIYQNYLSKETSDSLLDAAKPILVLSGHDHDQCTVIHSMSFGAVQEHTLGTISWQQGNLYPSFMLLSATSVSSSNASDTKNAVSTHLCFLPMQTHIYIWYLSQFGLTLLLLIIWPSNGFGFLSNFILLLKETGRNLLTTSKEKDEDENCEYEMIWDAEGSMHLVKKASNRVPTSKSDPGSAGRGNVFARPAAKKHIAAQQAASILLDINADSRTGNTVRPPQSKSKMRKLIQRTIRVIYSLAIIAAVNVPLYTMLLFKDWI